MAMANRATPTSRCCANARMPFVFYYPSLEHDQMASHGSFRSVGPSTDSRAGDRRASRGTGCGRDLPGGLVGLVSQHATGVVCGASHIDREHIVPIPPIKPNNMKDCE
jgi:hypothetical protein